MPNDTYSYILRNSPIVEATVDIFCSFKIPNEAIIGVVYNLLSKNKHENLKLEKLPICNIPEEIRKNDPNLKNKPTHQLTCDNGVIFFGTNNLSFGILPPYKSWEDFEKFIQEVLAIIKDANVINSIYRVSLRYLNFFKLNIFEKTNLFIMFNDQKISNPPTIFRTEISSNNGFVNVLQITNGVHLKNQLLKLDDDGSLIDITAVLKNASLPNIDIIIKRAHSEAKALFFDLLNIDFIKSLI